MFVLVLFWLPHHCRFNYNPIDTCDFTDDFLSGFQPRLLVMNLFVLINLSMCSVGHLNTTNCTCVIQQFVCVCDVT